MIDTFLLLWFSDFLLERWLEFEELDDKGESAAFAGVGIRRFEYDLRRTVFCRSAPSSFPLLVFSSNTRRSTANE